ncbi:hypothetical protein AA671_18770 [Delftia tsuruhatensis]|jgi:conjugative transfer region protein (TIGR03750 family)|uniref:TIGR03750 family conjugal transfer protein n=1 Tax=Delftia tsuruhatensis TaxID=180282 RepID=UPI000641AC0A|nr:TIGR03750 family conjugal transfer protein [Delftia tsuruhatensis]KLO58205.1 hypothetical protein AA671_18770 [Delftia tsuruhatensis]
MSLTLNARTDGTVAFLPHRLNRQPVVVRGLTADELWICCGLSASAGLLVGLPLALVLSTIALAPTFVLIGITLGLFVGGGMLRRLKRGRPETWLYRQMQWRLATVPVLGSWTGGAGLVTRAGVWSVRRSRS